MTAVATPPAVRVENHRDERGHAFTCLVGLPSMKGGEKIILVKPLPGINKGEMCSIKANGQEVQRSWTTERHFAGSVNLPVGVEVGYVNEYTDLGMGQPFVEKSVCQVSDDTLARIKAYAEGTGFLTMPERRKIARETEQWLAETQATENHKRDRTKTPGAVLAEVATDQMDARIKAASEAAAKTAVEAILSRYDLVPKDATPKE